LSNRKKREEFLKASARQRSLNWAALAVVLLLVVVGAFAITSSNRDTAGPRRFEPGNFNVGQKVSYQGKVVDMTDIPNQVAGGDIRFPLEAVKRSGLIFTLYDEGRVTRPLTAYVSPEGRLVVAVSYCEPCRSDRFHIEGDELVCNACGTRWRLNDLRGISGGCLEYPPEELPYTVEGATVVVPEVPVRDWQPRV
jgi:hypothetical protein